MSDKWVLLDAMGVIFEEGDDINKLLIPFVRERDPSITAEQVDDLYLEASVGRISARDFWRELGLGDQYPDIEVEYLRKCLRLDHGFRIAAQKMLHRYSLAMISNDLAEWSAFLREIFDLDRYFATTVISGEIGHRKPDPAIFDVFLDKTHAQASDCVLVDDRPKNLRAASELGFKTIWFMRERVDTDFEADAIICSFAELPDEVGRILG